METVAVEDWAVSGVSTVFLSGQQTWTQAAAGVSV